MNQAKIETDLSWIDFREAFDNVEDSVDDFLLAEMIIVRRESTDRTKETNLRLVRSRHRNPKVTKDCGSECHLLRRARDLGIWNESDDTRNERGEKVILEGTFLSRARFYKPSPD